MAGEEILAHGKIVVEVEENVRQELAKAEAAFDRTMEKLDRKEAAIRLDAKTEKFYAQVRKAQKELEEWRNKKATATLDVDKKEATNGIRRATRALKNYEKENVSVYNRINQIDSDRVAAMDKRGEAYTKAESRRAKAREDQARKTAKAIADAEAAATKAKVAEARKAAAEGKRIRDQEVKDENKRIRDAIAANKRKAAAEAKAAKDAADSTARAIKAAEDKAQREHLEAARKRQRAGEVARRAELKAEADALKDSLNQQRQQRRIADNILAQANRSEARAVKRAAQTRITEELKANRTIEADRERSGKLVKEYLSVQRSLAKNQSQQRRTFLTPDTRLELEIDERDLNEQLALVRARMEAIDEPPPELNFDVDSHGMETLGRWGKALSDTTVRLGPFTTSIGGAFRALALLGPVITGLIGATGALAGGIGVGLVGAVGIAGAALTGIVPLLGAVALTTKSAFKPFVEAKKTTDAYNKAVDQYGKKSEQAKTAQKKMNNQLAAMDPQMRKAFQGFRQFGKEWDKQVTSVARKNIGHVMAQSFKTANKLLPMFGKQTRDTFGRLDDGISSWMKRLRSKGGQDTLNTIFTNANRALTPLLNGLGNLGAAFGRIAASFSRELPGLAGAFEGWSEGLSNTTKNTGKLNGVVDRFITGMNATGHLLSSTTKLLAAFFGVAAEGGGGVQFMEDIASGMDDITAKIRANPDGLETFFGDAIGTTKDLYGVIKPLAKLFMEWATIMRPLTNIMLSILGPISSIVSEVAGFKPVKAILTAAFGIFLAGSLLSKIRSVTQALIALKGTAAAVGKTQIATNALSGLTGGFYRGRPAAPKMPPVTPGPRGGGVTPGGLIVPAGAARNMAQTEQAAARAATQVSRLSKAGTAAKVGMAGLSAVTLGVPSVFAGAAIAVGAAGAGLYAYANREREYEKAAKRSHAATRETQSLFYALPDAERQLTSSYLGLQQAQLDSASAEKEVARLRKAGQKGTEEYKQAVINMKNAHLAENSAKADAVRLGEEERKGVDRMVDSAKKAVTEANKRVSDREASGRGTAFGMKEDYAEFSKAAHAAGKSVEEFIKIRAKETGGMNGNLKAIKEYNDGLREQKEANQRLITAQNAAALASLNQKRAMKGLEPIARSAAKAFAEVAKAGGKGLSQKISLKFTGAGQAEKVAKSAAGALKGGVPKQLVTRIVANAKDAKDAVRDLNRLKISNKQMVILTKGGKEAVKMLEQIIGRKLTPKEQRIMEKGGAGVQKMLNRILGTKLGQKIQQIKERGGADALNRLRQILGTRLGNKTFNIQGNGAQQAINQLVQIQRNLDGIQDKTVRVKIIQEGRGFGASGKFMGGAFYSGGATSAAMGTSATKASMVDRAAVRAERKGPRPTTGGAYRTPTLLVGEESRTEYVIATNPAYKDRNRRYLKSAAGALGMKVVESAAMGTDPYGNTGGMTAGSTQFFADVTVGDVSGKGGGFKFNSKKARRRKKQQAKRMRKGLSPVAVRNPWSKRVNKLLGQQNDLEREASIREDAVREPEDFITETKDPKTGEITYGIDQPAVDQYREDISNVQKVYQALMDVTREIVETLPKAIKSVSEEIQARKYNKHKLEKEIKRQEDRLRLKGEKNEDERNAARDRLKKLRPALSRENKLLGDAKDARTELKGDVRKNAGFDNREYTKDFNDLGANLATLDDRAKTQKEEAAESGSSGGGDTPLSYGDQAALADTERANVLREYGGNMGAVTSGGPAGVGGGGMQVNPAASTVSTSPTAARSGDMGTTLNAISSGGTGGGTSNVLGAISGGTAAGTMWGAMSRTGSYSGGLIGGGATGSYGGKTINITNNYQTQPSDPHTWSAGVAYETAALL